MAVVAFIATPTPRRRQDTIGKQLTEPRMIARESARAPPAYSHRVRRTCARASRHCGN